MRGRKPRSTEEKLKRGETRPSRVNYQEPEVPPPASSDLQPPKDLRGAGFRLWRDFAPTMVQSGQLRATDMSTFLELCKIVTDIEHWEKESRLPGTDRDRDSALKIQRTLNQLRALKLRHEAELGMTSTSRSRVRTVTKPPVEKPKHERFFGKGALTVVNGGRK